MSVPSSCRRFVHRPALLILGVTLSALPVLADSTTRLVPIVLDVFSGTAHFTTELSLTNAERNVVGVTLRYTASLGSGSGSVPDTLSAGRQLVIPDVLAYLRGKGLQIPAGTAGQQAGTLLVTFDGVSASELVSATARTTTATGGLQPVGSAGLAYRGLNPNEQLSAGIPRIFGLRANATDRSNIAVYNSSTTFPVDFNITAFSGSGDGQSKVLREALTVGPLGWAQVSFGESGFSNGWAEVETGCFGADGCPGRAYGVINDNITNDGSYINPVSGDFTAGGEVNIPALVEAGAFRSELLLSNSSNHSQVFRLSYHESVNPAGGSGVVTLTLGPAEQRIIPNAIQFLRDNGVALAPAGSGSFVGSLYVVCPDIFVREIYAGARIASQSPSSEGGQYGLFSPEMVYNQAAITDDVYIFGLRADENNRSNVAVFNYNFDEPTNVEPSQLSLQVYDGDAGGVAAGTPEIVTVPINGWKQVNNILALKGVRNGWVKISLTDVGGGSHSWAAYGVINDGGGPGQRTGDGAYIEMEKRGHPSSGVSGDLLERVRTTRSRMPGARSEGFTKPSPAEQDEWRSVVTILASGDYDAAGARLAASSLPYQLVRFTDTGFEGRMVWALEENVPIQKGWGDLYLNPAPRKDLGVEAPHPLFDTDTELEATNIFRGSAARFLLIAGTHRCANSELSSCSGSTTACGDGRFHVSDAGHYAASMFQIAHEVFVGSFPAILVVNLHGNADSSCEDIFLSSGVAADAQPILGQLRDRVLAQGGLTVGIAGDGASACPLPGTTNVQGRFSNGSPDACAAYATAAGGRFIHIEQKIAVRTNPALYSRITSALTAIAPAVAQNLGHLPAPEG